MASSCCLQNKILKPCMPQNQFCKFLIRTTDLIWYGIEDLWCVALTVLTFQDAKQEDKIVLSECAYTIWGITIAIWQINVSHSKDFSSFYPSYYICFSLMSTCQSFILSLSVQLNLIMRWWWEFPQWVNLRTDQS